MAPSPLKEKEITFSVRRKMVRKSIGYLFITFGCLMTVNVIAGFFDPAGLSHDTNPYATLSLYALIASVSLGTIFFWLGWYLLRFPKTYRDRG
jgi:cation transporter-like permease